MCGTKNCFPATSMMSVYRYPKLTSELLRNRNIIRVRLYVAAFLGEIVSPKNACGGD